ncbi:hypothetical protein QFC22_001693 [Naganishia vaughanmartiniae]|uniref:Uncharacterized protein n=1 Tax=Naganishia vaughanmartiniae TaxID=1424756 RepID=A0ACC2XE07_9TREE|nr:hypothetical protein QFC22_001693 [Naganishia vaughanmartiniae]
MMFAIQTLTTWITVLSLLAFAQDAVAKPAFGADAHKLRRRTSRSMQPAERNIPQLQLRHNEQHHAKRARDGTWLIREKERMNSRYGGTDALARRGEATLANQDYDASYSASVSIGTPSQAFDIALDTGSADLWVAGSNIDLPTTFEVSKSTTVKNTSTSFSITYGSGNAQGYLASDTVSLAGYTVPSQTFAVIQTMSAGLINEPLSGLMGLGFSSLSVSKTTPWWVSLASSKWSDPVFAFYLKRYRNIASASSTESDGGSVSFGELDSSLYTGDITYIPVANNKQAYWNIPIAGITSQGTAVGLGSSVNAAIDTGTTLIGGPSSIVAAIYSAIPGSQAMTGSYAGYYEYPCSTKISLKMTFGTFTVEITEADFNIGSFGVDGTMCIGGIYVQSLSSTSAIQWIVGDTMLKNVYSVYRYSPAAVGFAKLASDTTSTGSDSSSGSSAAVASSSTSASSPGSSAASSTAPSTGSESGSAIGSTVSSGLSTMGSSSASRTSNSVITVTATSTSARSNSVVVATALTTLREASIPTAEGSAASSSTATSEATSSRSSAVSVVADMGYLRLGLVAGFAIFGIVLV